MQSKQFGFNGEETLKFADWDNFAGAVFACHYDRNGRLVKEQRPSAGDGENLTRYVYDSRGRLAEKQDSYGVTIERNQYDVMGRRVYQKLADGEEAEFRYGIHGNLEAVASPGSRKQGTALQSYRYNSRGQVTGMEDGNGNRTGYGLDAWGNILQIQAADGGREQYSYDYAGNLTSATDANGGTMTYRYNSLCQVVLCQEKVQVKRELF